MGGAGYVQMITQFLAAIGQAVSSYQYDSASAESADALANILQLASNQTEEFAGEVDFPEVDINPMELIFAFMNPNANPALMAATNAVLEGLGAPTAGVLEEGGPQARLMNQLGAMNLTQQKFNQAVKAVGNDGRSNNGETNAALSRAMTQAGYGSLKEFQTAQAEWEKQSAETQAAYAPIREQVLSGRTAAQTMVSQMQQDFPRATLSDINDLERRIIDQRVYDIDRRATEARAGSLQQANVMGLNPSGTLGEIEEERLGQIYDVEQSDGLARAIQLLSGRQNLATGGLQALQASLYGPVNAAVGAGTQYGQGVNSMGNLALSQAMAKNEALVNQEFFNTQQQTAEDMTQLQLMLSALGLQTQGGAMGVQSDWIDATKTARAFDTFTSSYGGGGGGGGGSNSQYQFGGLNFT